MGAPVLAGGEQAAVLPHFAADERQRAACRIQPVVSAEHAAGMGHALDHQGIPARQDLLVAAGADAFLARGEQLFARRSEQVLTLGERPVQ